MPPIQPIEIAMPIFSSVLRSTCVTSVPEIRQSAPTNPAYWIGRKR